MRVVLWYLLRFEIGSFDDNEEEVYGMMLRFGESVGFVVKMNKEIRRHFLNFRAWAHDVITTPLLSNFQYSSTNLLDREQ